MSHHNYYPYGYGGNPSPYYPHPPPNAETGPPPPPPPQIPPLSPYYPYPNSLTYSAPPHQYNFPHSGPLYPPQNPNFYPPPNVYASPPYSPSSAPHLNHQEGNFQYSYNYQYHTQPNALPVASEGSHHSLGPSSSSSSSHLYPTGDALNSGRLSASSSFGSYYSQDSFSRPFPAVEGNVGGSFHSYSGELQGNSESLQIVPHQNEKASLKVLLLHGNLDVWIIEAKNLPNLDMFHKSFADFFGMNSSATKVAEKINEHMPVKTTITSDPYVSVHISNAVVARTYVIPNNENPVWNQHSRVPVAHYAAEVRFLVKDNDIVGSQLIGIVSVPVEKIYGGGRVEGSFPILGPNRKPCKTGASLRLAIEYTPMERLTCYNLGVGCGPEYHGIRGTYFPLRRGGKLTLYQDAHVDDGSLPAIKLSGHQYFYQGKCWRDIFDAIVQARRLIYITGWSVYHMVRLIRDQGDTNLTLGNLLKQKSQEGVRVLLLVWDDPTSRRILGLQTEGVMATHDEETKKFFRHSSVRVLLCPRSAGKRHSFVKKQETGVFYTHHQKSVVVDSDAGYGRRKIIAFVGGLDLCDGRYDTPNHTLFRTLTTIHQDDYHNPTFPAGVIGPREPWHDLHCKIDGPAAYDVLTNFEERWQKSWKRHGVEKIKRTEDDSLLLLDRMPDIYGINDAPFLSDNDPEAWHVQIFRTIDSNSVKGFPKDPKVALSKNLICGKNHTIDISIQTAYIEAIRAAQHFIYIENQYFIGSSYNWSSHNEVGADHLIPMEIALKVAQKIRANERFSVYVVIPMWPEGVPTATTTQRILYWQNRTMQMMYEVIYKALEDAGLENTYHPRDYLSFFCLGNREAVDGHAHVGPKPTHEPQVLAVNNRRFMIYVHSKGMIVDDEYVILGSANINQRSMDGSRDTEIAMGAYQPQYTWAKKHGDPRGQVYGYRMSLWAEHLGMVEECFTSPESLECVRRINQLSESNWQQFIAPNINEMNGHLMRYPVEVERTGKVKPLLGSEKFPDCDGNIVGTFVIIQENLTL